MTEDQKRTLSDRLTTHTLTRAAWGSDVTEILASSLRAVEPRSAVMRQVKRDGDFIHIAGQRYNLGDIQRVYVVGAGKACAPMAEAIAQLLGDRLARGIVIVKEGHVEKSSSQKNLQFLEAGHPIPDERGVKGTKCIIQLLKETDEKDLVICLISGGGSALMVSPVPGVSLSDLQSLTSLMLACGAEIKEINTLRKHLEQLKGGSLARLASPARLVALILSDVVGDPLDAIASGPTAPDTTTFQDAWEVVQRYDLIEQAPGSIREYLQRGLHGEAPETPKPGEAFFTLIQNVIVASNRHAAKAAFETAQSKSYNTLLLTTSLQGEARSAGLTLAKIAQRISHTGQPVQRPACIIAGGETTVTLHGNGLGGRNQEVALSAVRDLTNLPLIALVTLATDGGDGPTDAAGAVVTGETFHRAQQIGLDPDDFLARNDSYHFFEPLGDLLKPGPTQTNVNDLSFIFAF